MKLSTLMLVGAFALSTLAMTAQNSAVTNASMSLKAAKGYLAAEEFDKAAKELAEAVGYIEPATTHEKTMKNEKTWRYRGDIYQLIARNTDKEAYAAIDKMAVSKAAESYEKAMSFDKKGSYEKENKLGLATMQNLAVNGGINAFNANDFEMAFTMFDQGAQMAKSMGITDTLAIFNAGLAADRAERSDDAIKYYNKAIEIGYDEPNLYKFIHDLQMKKGDTAAANAALAAGLERYPTNQGLLIDQVNKALDAGEMESALNLLKKTLEQDPDNAELQYNVGAVYDNLGKLDEARAAYQESINIDPKYFDAYYNLGASHYNEGVEKTKTCNAIAPSKIKEYDACKAAADVIFGKASPFLEKAHEILPDDQSTIASLVEIYTRTNNLQKAKEMRALIKK